MEYPGIILSHFVICHILMAKISPVNGENAHREASCSFDWEVGDENSS